MFDVAKCWRMFEEMFPNVRKCSHRHECQIPATLSRFSRWRMFPDVSATCGGVCAFKLAFWIFIFLFIRGLRLLRMKPFAGWHVNAWPMNECDYMYTVLYCMCAVKRSPYFVFCFIILSRVFTFISCRVSEEDSKVSILPGKVSFFFFFSFVCFF